MPMKWYGTEAKLKVNNAAATRIEYAARMHRDYIRTRLSAIGDPPASAGTYPYKRSGHLRRNVQMEMDRKAVRARVGTNVLYGKFLEFGTRRMAARPWLSLALRENRAAIRAILGQGPTV